jgi:hypothetical protein
MTPNLLLSKVQRKMVNGIFVAWIDHCTYRMLSQQVLVRRVPQWHGRLG